MNSETSVDAKIQAMIAGIVSILSAVGTFLGISPQYTTPYFSGLVATGLSGIVAIYFAVKHIQAGKPVSAPAAPSA